MPYCRVRTRQQHRILCREETEEECSWRLPCRKQTPSTAGWTLGPGTGARELHGAGCPVPPEPGAGGQNARRSGGRGGRQRQRGTAMGRKKNKKGPGGREGRLVVTFDEERRR